MAASSKVYENKQGRDEYLNGGLALPDAKRTNSERLVDDNNIMALLEKIDNMDTINCNREEAHTAIQLEDERLNGVMKSVEDEVGLKGHEYDVESIDIDEKGSTEMASIKQITDWNSEATSVYDTGDMHSEGYLTYYDEVREDLGFFVDHTAVELGLIMNLIDGDSMANLYFDAVYGYTETTAVFSGSLWEDDIWQLNGHLVFENDFH